MFTACINVYHLSQSTMSKLNLSYYFISAGLLSTLVTLVDSMQLSSIQRQRLDDFVTSLMKCRNNVGVSLAIVQDGQTVFADGFGFRDLDNDLIVEADTKINIGSLTKSFTSTLAADAVGQGLTTWDTPLKDYVPDFELEGEFRTEETSLRDLFSHKVGMPSYWGLSTAHMNISREDLARRMRYFPVLYNFRSRFLYSNYLYMMASWATQVLTGRPWEEHVKNTLLDPLGMGDTKPSADLEDEDWENLALSYIYDADQDVYIANPERDQLPFMTEIGPAGGIFASARDMAKYMNFHLSEGKNEAGEQLVPQEALRNTHSRTMPASAESPQILRPRFPVDAERFTYALAWYNGVYRGMQMLYHTGSYSSYNCRMTLLPSMDVGAWACVNSPGDSRGSTAVKLLNMFALDLLLDIEPWLNETTACTFPSPWSTEAIVDEDNQPMSGPIHYIPLSKSRDLTDYVGTYSHAGFGDFHVFLNESENVLYYSFGALLSGRLKEGESNGEFFMTLNHPLTYRMHFYPQYPLGFPVQFGDSADGTVVETIRVPYLEFSLPPVFTRAVKASNGQAATKPISWKKPNMAVNSASKPKHIPQP